MARYAAGPDGIPPVSSRHATLSYLKFFNNIFNQFLSLFVVPLCFKVTTIVPIPKKTPTSCLNDYYPIAFDLFWF